MTLSAPEFIALLLVAGFVYAAIRLADFFGAHLAWWPV